MPLPTQTASEEFTERIGETAPGVLVMPHMVAVDDYRRNQAAARQRVNEAHAMHKRAMGVGDIGKDNAAADDMGDMIYTGDITIQPGGRVQLGKGTSIAAEDEPPSKAKDPIEAMVDAKESWLPKLALAAAMLGGGSGIGYILHDWLKPPTVAQPQVEAVDTDSDTSLDLSLPE